MANEVVKKESVELSVIEQVVMQGDLSKLTPDQRVLYYKKVCESSGLNPLTRPYEYIMLNGKLTLYAKKDATEQLRKLNGISIEKLSAQVIDDLYIVTATARDKTGRTDESTGAVTIGHLKGDAKANALMKAETKAKRRVTLSISGLGCIDETEVDSIPEVRKVNIDVITGEIIEDEIIEHVPQLDDSAERAKIRAEITKEQFDFSPAQNERFADGLKNNTINLDTATIDQLQFCLHQVKKMKGG